MATTKVRYNQIKTGLPVGGDVNYDDVSLLLLMNGANGSTVFTDSSNSNLSNSFLGVNISTTESKFGGSSAYFDGNDDAIYYSNSGGEWDFGGQSSWTVEGWFYNNGRTGTSRQIIGNYKDSDEGWSVDIRSTEKLAAYFSGDGPDIVSTTTISQNTWYHFAVVNNNDTFTLYLDGASEGTYSGSTNLTGSSRFSIGALWYTPNSSWLNEFQGYIDNVRITNNVARYTSNFSVPTEAFPAFESKEGKRLIVNANESIELES